MPANRNALIRYKTIDNCLRNPYRRWTLEDLVDACSDALYEYEGIDKGISKRTVQMDIQMMRSEKLGYNAPIVVYENKYYKYEDPEYSITQTPLNEQDLKTMSEAVEVSGSYRNTFGSRKSFKPSAGHKMGFFSYLVNVRPLSLLKARHWICPFLSLAEV
jgi:hypothetical protein